MSDDLVHVTVTREDIPADALDNVGAPHSVITGTADNGRRVSFPVSWRFVATVKIDGYGTLELEPDEILTWEQK